MPLEGEAKMTLYIKKSVLAMAAIALSLNANAQVADVAASAQSGQPENFRNASVSITPLSQFSFNKDLSGDIGQASIAFDGQRVYLSSPDGVVLSGDALGFPLQPIFQSQNNGVGNIYVYNHALYVLTGLHQSESEDHAMFESKDQGQTFAPIDSGLRTCAFSVCSYITADQLFVKDDLLFANAGGGRNLQVSHDQGATWIPLSGTLEGQACYSSPFAISGRTVLQGGECPLDSAFLGRGVLNANMQFLDTPLMSARTPDLGNRKIYAIAYQSGESVTLAGAEGTILRSTNDGQTWKAAMEEPLVANSYSYVEHFVFSSRKPGVVLAAGFDKSGDTPRPYLALSTRSGSEWIDISSQLGNIKDGVISDLTEDAQGRLIAVVIDSTARKVTICQVIVRR
jgi:hypothetical protein